MIFTFMISCTDDDCDGHASEINARYDALVAEEMSSPGVPNYDNIDLLEEKRYAELGRACDQTHILPQPEIPQP